MLNNFKEKKGASSKIYLTYKLLSVHSYKLRMYGSMLTVFKD